MLDFNDAPAELPQDSGVTRESLRADLVARLESVLATLFPAGKKRKGKFLIGDVLGSPGDSLEVVLDGEKTGLWTDRATGDGGDIFDLIAAHLGANVQTDFPRVLQHAAFVFTLFLLRVMVADLSRFSVAPGTLAFCNWARISSKM